MQDLQIEPTKKTPLVQFFNSGKLILAGSAYPENANDFFDPLIRWIVEFHAEAVDFDLIIEYINTAAAKKLMELLHKLQSNTNIGVCQVNWFYQKWDDDGLETGQILSDSLPGITFDFVEYESKDKG